MYVYTLHYKLYVYVLYWLEREKRVKNLTQLDLERDIDKSTDFTSIFRLFPTHSFMCVYISSAGSVLHPSIHSFYIHLYILYTEPRISDSFFYESIVGLVAFAPCLLLCLSGWSGRWYWFAVFYFLPIECCTQHS